MNRKILTSLLIIGVVSGMMGLGTFANFSDSEETTGTFTAGTLNLEIPDSNGQDFSVSFTNMAPGEWTSKQKLVLENVGSIDQVINSIRVSDLTEKDQVVTITDDDNSILVDITIEDLGNKVKWTFDADETDPDFDNGHMGVALVISQGGVHPDYQIHFNDGTCGTWSWGTPLYSPYDDGWHTGDASYNTYVGNLGWVSASGERDLSQNTEAKMTVTIKKNHLDDEFYWGAQIQGDTVDTIYPDTWDKWNGDASGLEPAKFNENVGPYAFAKKINVEVYHNGKIRSGTLWDFYTSGGGHNMILDGDEITLDTGDTGWYNFRFQLDDSADNPYQGDGVEATFTIGATQ